MSIPKKHHYLPEFYLKRWARNGVVIRYTRLDNEDQRLLCEPKTPAQVAREPYLYSLPDMDDPREIQSVELNLFQKIDAGAALALEKFEQQKMLSRQDHIVLCKFVISLLYRTPKRLEAMKRELAKHKEGAPYTGLTGQAFDDKLKATTNRLLAMLVEGETGLSIVSKFNAYRIVIRGASKTLVTSDRPLTVSRQLVANDAFMLLPYAPDRLLILTHHKAIADSFATQNPNNLVSGINQAVVEQSENIVVAADRQASKMIERLFLRRNPDHTLDPLGLIRRRSPLVDLWPKTRSFSRNSKRDMKYLGR
jgi:hypothetical protein